MTHDLKLVEAVARAMVKRPDAVVADYPTEGGGRYTRYRWQDRIKDAIAALDAIEAQGFAVIGPKHVAQIDEMQDILNEIKAAGWVLVPPVPTLKQTFAGQEALLPDHPAMPGPATVQVTTGSFDKIYRAMVAARPGAQP